MGSIKVISINESVFAQNDIAADQIRYTLKEKGVFFVNVMSAPGSGKTTLLTELIGRMKEHFRIALMNVDIESSLDANHVAERTGVPSMQIHNGGLCHIDADMTKRAIDEFDIENIDLLILENIGNLVCPAEFDTGAHLNIMLLSLPEGDDKPLKYPLMFSVSDVVLITKTDTACFFSFDMEKAEERIRKLNPDAVILPVCAKTGDGMDELVKLFEEKITQHKEFSGVRN